MQGGVRFSKVRPDFGLFPVARGATVNQSSRQQTRDQLGSSSNPKLNEDMAQVKLYRLLANLETAANFGIC
jgi:hypothetical protein